MSQHILYISKGGYIKGTCISINMTFKSKLENLRRQLITEKCNYLNYIILRLKILTCVT